MTIALDHLMWGAPSLEVGMEQAERLFGVTPAKGGVHPGLGTCNALLSLGDDAYLEIIAPDPEQVRTNNLGGRLETLERPGLITWAAAAAGLGGVGQRARAQAMEVRGPLTTSRTAPDGELLQWELLFLSGHAFGNLVPFFIDWLQTPHPASTNPVGGEMRGIELRSTDAGGLTRLLETLEIDVAVHAADVPGITALIETERGLVRLETASEARAWTI